MPSKEFKLRAKKEHMKKKHANYLSQFNADDAPDQVKEALLHIEASSKDHTVGTKETLINAQQTIEGYIMKQNIEYDGVSINRAKWQQVTDKVGHQGYESVQQLLGQLEKLVRAAGERKIHFECSPDRHSQLANRLQTERENEERAQKQREAEAAAKEAAAKEDQRLKDIETARIDQEQAAKAEAERIAKENLEIAAKEDQRLKDIETARIAQEKEDEEETFSIPSPHKTEEITIDITGDPNNPLVDYELSY